MTQIAHTSGGLGVQAIRPGLEDADTQVVGIGAASATSTAAPDGVSVAIVTLDIPAHIRFGDEKVGPPGAATVLSHLYPANTLYHFRVTPGTTLSFIQTAAGGGLAYVTWAR